MKAASTTAEQAFKRPVRPWKVVLWIAIAIVLISPLVAIFVWSGAAGDVRQLVHHYTVLSFLLLYVEESGIPLPVPGDVFVISVGANSPRQPLLLVAAGLGLVVCVVLGSTNLYLVSRTWGRRLVSGYVAAVLDLSPQRLERAERWFKRWGPLAIIFGRHIPGFRLPVTVAAGLFRVPWRVFAACVAISSAIWVAVFMTLGLIFGRHVESFLGRHRYTYVTIPAALAVIGIVFIGYRLLAFRRERAEAG